MGLSRVNGVGPSARRLLAGTVWSRYPGAFLRASLAGRGRRGSLSSARAPAPLPSRPRAHRGARSAPPPLDTMAPSATPSAATFSSSNLALCEILSPLRAAARMGASLIPLAPPRSMRTGRSTRCDRRADRSAPRPPWAWSRWCTAPSRCTARRCSGGPVDARDANRWRSPGRPPSVVSRATNQSIDALREARRAAITRTSGGPRPRPAPRVAASSQRPPGPGFVGAAGATSVFFAPVARGRRADISSSNRGMTRDFLLHELRANAVIRLS